MMLPEKIALKPFVSTIPLLARREIVRDVTKFPIAFRVPPLKSMNCPKPRGVSAASMATSSGPPRGTIMFGPMKDPKAKEKTHTLMVSITVLVAVAITEIEPTPAAIHGAVRDVDKLTVRSHGDAYRRNSNCD